MAAFVNRLALVQARRSLKHERLFGWIRKGHKHRMIMLEEHVAMIEARQSYLGEGAHSRKREAA
jgi:hypothetical protein